VHDCNRKRKTLDDPLVGPSRAQKGIKRGHGFHTEATVYGVRVKNAHLVSENFLRFIYMALYAHRDNDLEAIIFDPDGNPVVDGREVFAIYDAGSNSIVINLRRHFENAMRVAEHGITNFSMHALIWSVMVGSFLHEFKHALDRYENPDVPYEMRAEQESIAEQWATEARTAFARYGHTELPAISEEPYFGPLVTEFLDRIIGDGQPQWAVRQRLMLNDGVYYRNVKGAFDIRSMRKFYELSYRGLDQDGPGRYLNQCVGNEQAEEEELWRQEEMAETAAKEAIEKGYRIKIDYVTKNGTLYKDRLIQPERIFSKNGYIYVEAFCELRQSKRRFRIDRIQNIIF
jgi:hypothetical protein